MRILITGGFGFIGSRLGQYFHERGFEVILGSRKKRPSPTWLPEAKIVLIKWDEVENLRRICNGIDIILHCAGMNAGDCVANPKAALDFNGLATERFAHAAAISDVKTFVYFSTAHVYSDIFTGEISEKLKPSNDHPYASTHLLGEFAALTSNQNSKMNVIVLRLSNIVGAPADKSADCWGLIANDLCRQAIESKEIMLRTSGKQHRNFMGISQLLKAVDHLIIRSPENKSEIFNVGGNNSISIIELAKVIQTRFKIRFNASLPLIIPDNRNNEEGQSFDFKIDHLLSTNFKLDGKLESDIDELLVFCKNSFTQAS